MVRSAEIIRARALAEQGIIEGAIGPPVPPELKDTKPGSQVDSGAFVRVVCGLMRRALHEYRDEASLKVRTYCAMARSEGPLHRWLHRRRSPNKEPSALRLTESGRDILASWRSHEVPSFYKPTATVEDDPTRRADAAEVQALESDAGLTWPQAAERS